MKKLILAAVQSNSKKANEAKLSYANLKSL